MRASFLRFNDHLMHLSQRKWVGVFLFLLWCGVSGAPVILAASGLPLNTSGLRGSTGYDDEGPVCLGPGCGEPVVNPLELTRELLQETFDFQDERFSDEMSPRTSLPTTHLEVGMERTDNVPAISDELARQLEDRADLAYRADLTCDAATRKTAHGDFRLQMDVSRVDYRRLDSFDGLTMRIAPVWRRWDNGRKWQIRPWISRMDLGSKPYLQGWGLDGSGLFPRGNGHSFEVRVQIKDMNFLQGASSPQEDRDGREWKLGVFEHLRRQVFRDRKAFFGIGAELARRAADGSDYDSLAMGFMGFGSIEFHPRLQLTGTAAFQHREYRNPNHRDPLGRARDDRNRTFQLRCEYQLGRPGRRQPILFVSFLDRRNESNLESLFGYRSRTVAGGFLFDF